MSEYEANVLRDDLSQVLVPGLPGAGSGFTVTPSGAEYSRIRLISFRLVTSAVAANRVVSVALTHADGVAICTLPAGTAQTTGLTWDYTYALGLTPYTSSAGNAVVSALPDVWLPHGGSVVVSVAAIDAGDVISRPHVVLDQVYALGGE